MSDTRAFLAALRDDGEIKPKAFTNFANGLADSSVSDAQAGAFAMVALLKGLSREQRVALTLAMRDSGDVLSWQLDRPVLDKHSTGGIGDCVSLLLAPALAACGAAVPMVSGRGLGHTGGTLDKLEAIPGFKTGLEEAEFKRIVATSHLAIVSASANIAPADKRLYAIRDVTATVESLDLITASILSKKLAAGLGSLVLDVKTGSGAFMRTIEDSRALAHSLVKTANAAGCRTSALITDMNQPLVPSLGNALEIAEVMRVLKDPKKTPLLDISAALGGVALADANLSENAQTGAEAIMKAVQSGAAAEAFGRMVHAQGGPVQFVDSWQRFLPEANNIRELRAPQAGYISAYAGEKLGLAVVHLGGGRTVETDKIDPAVGLTDLLPLGTYVNKGDPIARVHASRADQATQAEAAVFGCITIGEKPETPPLIYERIS